MWLRKKQDTQLLVITSENVDTFSKFLHCQVPKKTVNVFVTDITNSSQLHCYTVLYHSLVTLWKALCYSTVSLYTHTHTFNGPFLGLRRWAGTRKVKPIWILLEQQTVSGSGICWTICKSAPRSRQITTPAPHHSSFLQARCPSCCPTNSVKALKARI